ncbi:Pro-resilin [Dufourea novaeangliae]|uniref:Pro-resilin n=1 Tax=Dufourea novaeangliae TaxID=178035 RepID=A0A154PA74_DUFNO|nr:Pro-resilin [Dufourea novaeangliae]
MIEFCYDPPNGEYDDQRGCSAGEHLKSLNYTWARIDDSRGSFILGHLVYQFILQQSSGVRVETCIEKHLLGRERVEVTIEVLCPDLVLLGLAGCTITILCMAVVHVISDLPPGTRRNTYLPPEPTKGYNYDTPGIPFPKPTTTRPPFSSTTPYPSRTTRPYNPKPTTKFPSPRPTPGTGYPPPGPRPTPEFPDYGTPTGPTPGGVQCSTSPPPCGPGLEKLGRLESWGKYPPRVTPTVVLIAGLCDSMTIIGMPFDFNYAVKEDAFGNDYSHNAISDGDIVRGEYRVQLPDGRLQIVRYTADWKHGFSAQVSYDGNPRFDVPRPTGTFQGY